MHRPGQIAFITVGLLGVAALAFMGSIIGGKSGEPGQERTADTALRCALDGSLINTLYAVDAYLEDDTFLRFCSIDSASKWFQMNKKDKVRYFTVVDEVTGERLDASLAHFVASDVVTVPEVRNRTHAFWSKEDAAKHIRDFNGRSIANPFGSQFTVPKIARLDEFKVGAPSLPDALPIQLAVFRPIFRENRLNVTIVPFGEQAEDQNLFADESVDALVCDLPAAILLTQRIPSARIVKNILRANPFRPLFALVAAPNADVRHPQDLEGKSIAIQRSVNSEFYLDCFLTQAGLPLDKVIRQEVDDFAKAWEMVIRNQVTAALLRTPFTEVARKRGMLVLADDCNFPWMSVLVVKEVAHPGKLEATKKFLFSLEQAGLALNLKPDEFRAVLKQKGGIPPDSREWFPMPIFEGSNAPAPDEMEPIMGWLIEKRLLSGRPAYEQVVDTRFLSDPDSVGLAFCCR